MLWQVASDLLKQLFSDLFATLVPAAQPDLQSTAVAVANISDERKTAAESTAAAERTATAEAKANSRIRTASEAVAGLVQVEEMRELAAIRAVEIHVAVPKAATEPETTQNVNDKVDNDATIVVRSNSSVSAAMNATEPSEVQTPTTTPWIERVPAANSQPFPVQSTSIQPTATGVVDACRTQRASSLQSGLMARIDAAMAHARKSNDRSTRLRAHCTCTHAHMCMNMNRMI